MLYYAVARGKETGVFVNKQRVCDAIEKYPAYRLRKFSSKHMAQAYVMLYLGRRHTEIPDDLGAVNRLSQSLLSGKKVYDGFMEAEEVDDKENACKEVSSQKTGSQTNDSSAVAVRPVKMVMTAQTAKKNCSVMLPEKSVVCADNPFDKKIEPYNPLKTLAGPLDWEVYTDGSYYAETKRGGYASYMFLGGHAETPLIVAGAKKKPKNGVSTMELTAVWKSLKHIGKTKPKGQIHVYTDYRIIVDVFELGLYKAWKKRRWVGSAGKPIRNRKLWKKIHSFCKKHPVVFHWVEGHTNIYYNELCDRVARMESGLI